MKSAFTATPRARQRCMRESRRLTPEDVADTILWAVTRPAHVNIARIVLTTIDQANSLLFNRKA